KKMNYLTLDEGEIGGTVAKYPRQKLVMTSPVEFPLYGKFKKLELSKCKQPILRPSRNRLFCPGYA
ncbi:MAG: hypothetical protein ABSA33_06655, partial [Candidatus Micrarchaeaceae archaeon]